MSQATPPNPPAETTTARPPRWSRRSLLAGGVGVTAIASLGGLTRVSAAVDPALEAYPPLAESIFGGATEGAAPATWAAVRALGPGINFGNMLEAPSEGAWGQRVEAAYPRLVAQAGFRHVRLPVAWSRHASADAAALIEPAFLARVASVVDSLLAQGLGVVVNLHHNPELDEPEPPAGAPPLPALGRLRFLALWAQIAQRFAGYPASLWFELYNEPHGNLNAARWADLASRTIRLLRSHPAHAQRILVMGPWPWNNSWGLSQWVPPDDAYLVGTFHHYEPMALTHQGASWAGPELANAPPVACCDADLRAQTLAPFTIAQRWMTTHRRPLWIGEFGVYGGPPNKPTDMASRVAWTSLVRREADRLGIPWAYWELASGFGVFDPATQRWREPLLKALLGA